MTLSIQAEPFACFQIFKEGVFPHMNESNYFLNSIIAVIL